MYNTNKQARQISLDNGKTYKAVIELTDAEVETVLDRLAAGCGGYNADTAYQTSAVVGWQDSDRDWLTAYMERLPYNIVIG